MRRTLILLEPLPSPSSTTAPRFSNSGTGRRWLSKTWLSSSCPVCSPAHSGAEPEKYEILILVATSGDTGKAALEGFADVPGVRIFVFYPHEGVSEMQRLQMVTQRGANVGACAVVGNFDDAQNGVKGIFSDPAMKDKLAAFHFRLSSANSINWGRLAPQIVYYFSAYQEMVAAENPAGTTDPHLCSDGELRQHSCRLLRHPMRVARIQTPLRLQPKQRTHRIHPHRGYMIGGGNSSRPNPPPWIS